MQQTYFFGLLSYEKRGKRNNSANLGLKKKGRSCCSEKCLMFRLCGNQRSFWSYLWAVWRWVCICSVSDANSTEYGVHPLTVDSKACSNLSLCTNALWPVLITSVPNNIPKQLSEPGVASKKLQSVKSDRSKSAASSDLLLIWKEFLKGSCADAEQHMLGAAPAGQGEAEHLLSSLHLSGHSL